MGRHRDKMFIFQLAGHYGQRSDIGRLSKLLKLDERRANFFADRRPRVADIVNGLPLFSVRVARDAETGAGMTNHNQLWSLTNREQDVVFLSANGFSAKEVAQELDIAPRTVERHLENCRLKFHARNRTHLVAICLSSGMVAADIRNNREPVLETAVNR